MMVEERKVIDDVLVEAVGIDPKGLLQIADDLFCGPWRFCMNPSQTEGDEAAIFSKRILEPASHSLTILFLLRYMIKEENRVWNWEFAEDLLEHVQKKLGSSPVDIAIMEQIKKSGPPSMFTTNGENDEGLLRATVFPLEGTAILRGKDGGVITLVMQK